MQKNSNGPSFERLSQMLLRPMTWQSVDVVARPDASRLRRDDSGASPPGEPRIRRETIMKKGGEGGKEELEFSAAFSGRMGWPPPWRESRVCLKLIQEQIE